MIIPAFSTGTRYGLSSFEEFYFCDRKAAYLHQQKMQEWDTRKLWMQEEKGAKGLAVFLIGSMFGAAYEAFYRGEDIPYDFKFTYEGQDVETLRANSANEARRVFNHFRGLASRSDFGEVLSTEEQYEAPLDVFGGPLTGASDLVVRLSQEDCDRLEAKFGITLFGSGIYLVDAKTASRREADRHEVWATRPQMKAYMMLHALKHNVEVKGGIYDVCYKLTIPERELFVVPPIGEDDLKMIATMVQKRAEVLSVGGWEKARANPTDNCHACTLFRQGLCRRY